MKSEKAKRLRLNLIAVLIFLVAAYFMFNLVVFGSRSLSFEGILTQQKQMEELQRSGKTAMAVITNIDVRSQHYSSRTRFLHVTVTFQPDPAKPEKKITAKEIFPYATAPKNLKKGDSIKIVFDPKNPWIFRIADTLQDRISAFHSLYVLFVRILLGAKVLIAFVFVFIVYLFFAEKSKA